VDGEKWEGPEPRWYALGHIACVCHLYAVYIACVGHAAWQRLACVWHAYCRCPELHVSGMCMACVWACACSRTAVRSSE